MTLARFKLKKANAPTKLATFQKRPSWEELALKIAHLFNVSKEHVGVVYVDDKRDTIPLNNEEDLQHFYEYLGQSSEAIKLVVQDVTLPDNDTVITATWSNNSNLSELSKGDDKFKLFCWILDKSDNPFPVDIAQSETVGDLKKKIKDEDAELDYLAASLTLYKLIESIPVDPDDTLAERIHGRRDDFSTFATRLSSGKKLSDIFQAGPPDDCLHIIVQCPPVADSKRGFPSKELPTIVVVPIEGEELQDHLLLEVRSWNRIVTMPNRIRDEFRTVGLVGEFFRSNLEILPLPTTPTMNELWEINLAELRTEAYRNPEDFPTITFAKFFSRFYVEGRQDLCVHFLVWLPPQDRRFPEDLTPAITWFISSTLKTLLNFEDATIASRNREDTQPKFKTLLKQEYHQPDDGKLFDMATGTRLPYSIVVASHIFQHKWRNELSRFTSQTDINDVRNGLLLYKPVEWAFDRAKICVEVKSPDEMTFRLLDQDLRDTILADKACDLRNEAKRGNRRLVEERNLHMTFGDLDGQPLKFPEDVVMRPSKRMLGLHAVLAQIAAQDRAPQHRIRDVAYDTSGDEITDRAIKNYSIVTWLDQVET